MKILMVCIGNICRSPMAEGIMENMIKKQDLPWSIDSAGTSFSHIGEAPHLFSQKVAQEHGINLSKQRARQFKKEDLEKFDKIYAMEKDVYEDIIRMTNKPEEINKVDLLLNESYPDENKSVPDPWYGGEAGFHQAWKLISDACNKIIEKYN
ncbi:MAG TPA: low molecular weight protein-tyrosine-phosphatase [Chitinophagaceae bacterium]|nr:low molecular weight protein-tyrosine-phosphatase [Chitinophagaceae bacterium]